MSARNALLASPPYAVEGALQRLGANLRIARLRRNLTLAEMAEKIGTGRRAIMEAEKGKPSTAVAVYAALLWAMDLLDPFEELGEPTKDEEGQTRALSRERSRARQIGKLENDF